MIIPNPHVTEQITKSVLIVFCLLVVACSSHTSTQNNGSESKLTGKALEYYQEKTGNKYAHRSEDQFDIRRQDMAEFASGHIELGAGFKYRIRPSKTPSWRYLAIGSSGTQYIVDLKHNQVAKKLTNAGGKGTDWHPDKPWLVGMGAGVLRLTNVLTGEVIKKWKPTVTKRNIHFVYDIKFFPDGEKILFTYRAHNKEKSRMEIWDVTTKSPTYLKTIKRPHDGYFGGNVIFSPGSQYFSFDQQTQKTEDGSRQFTFWSTSTLKPVRRFSTSEKDYVRLRFHQLSGNTMLFAKGRSSQLELYVLTDEFEIKTHHEMQLPKEADLRNYDVTDVNGRPIEMEDWHSSVSLFFLNKDVEKGLNKRTKFVDIGPGNRIGDALFGPNGKKIYLVTGNGDLWIYSVKKLLELYRRFTTAKEYYRWKARKKFGQEQKETGGTTK